MTVTIGCLHAHYSNAAYFDGADQDGVRFLHFVEPGIHERLDRDASYGKETASGRLEEMIEWMVSCGADAALVTCTEYCSMLPESLGTKVPVLRLDELFFRSLAAAGPTHLLFSNPMTVGPTMQRLWETLGRMGIAADRAAQRYDHYLVENAFKLIMNGHKDAYMERVLSGLQEVAEIEAEFGGRRLAVAQLSMVDAALVYERETGQPVLSPLQAVLDAIRGLCAK